MLHLEYNFVCFLTYKKLDGLWKECVTPFFEWQEYMRFHREQLPIPIEGSIKKWGVGEFPFLADIEILLKACQEKPTRVDLKKATAWLPQDASEDKKSVQKYLDRLLDKILLLELGEINNKELHLTRRGESWREKPRHEQAMALYRHPFNKLLIDSNDPVLLSEKSVREAEKALKK